MNRKDKLKIITINLGLFALLFGLVTLNKEFLRPLLRHKPFAGVLTGSFPNFIAAFIIGLAPLNAVLIRAPKHGRLIVYICSLLVFAGLTIEELVPLWGASSQYDPFDILANGIGSGLAVLTYELIVYRRKNKQ
jgi:hypothetical protein